MTRRILALNPWHGGSHQAFLEGWIQHSRHDFTVLPLPAYKWKWRMRHAAVTFSEQLHEMLPSEGTDSSCWDVLFCTDMLGLAEFRGLCPTSIRELPTIVYFHENQLTYPTQQDDERDFHFAYSNMTSALAADAVWFNSAFHRDEFLAALRTLLLRMPDYCHEETVDSILAKSVIQPPGIDRPEANLKPRARSERKPGPLRIVWVSRWEHDKNPELFFEALSELTRQGVPFEVSVLGESFRNSPTCFGQARDVLASRIRHWGFAKSRADYFRVLSDSDVVVSTAQHEFFGISILEAVAAGCHPLVPDALAYPETLGRNPSFFHNGTPEGIAAALSELAGMVGPSGQNSACIGPDLLSDVSRYFWDYRSAEMDLTIEHLCHDA